MRNLSWRIGRVAGIDLFLHPTFLLLLAFGAITGGLDYAVLIAAVFGCVVLHELGHALTARAFGISTHDITLYPIGGVARLERMPRSPGAELLITLAGPMVNVAIASALALALRVDVSFVAGSALWGFARTLMLVNWMLAAFNMIPAFPMDGGRVLRALLCLPLGRYRATEIAAGVGRVLAVTLPLGLWWAFGTFNPMHLILAAFIFVSAGWELSQVRADEDRRRGASGLWTAPSGYRWVRLGHGSWQLAPIHAHVHAQSPSWGRRP